MVLQTPVSFQPILKKKLTSTTLRISARLAHNRTLSDRIWFLSDILSGLAENDRTFGNCYRTMSEIQHYRNTTGDDHAVLKVPGKDRLCRVFPLYPVHGELMLVIMFYNLLVKVDDEEDTVWNDTNKENMLIQYKQCLHT